LSQWAEECGRDLAGPGHARVRLRWYIPYSAATASHPNVQAAQAYRLKTENLLDLVSTYTDPYTVITQIRADRDDAENSYIDNLYKIRNRNTFVIGYALYIHDTAGQYFRDCLEQIDKMDLGYVLSSEDAQASLRLIFGTDGGGQSGSFELDMLVYEGYDSTFEVTDDQISKAIQKAELAVEQLALSMDQTHQSQVTAANVYTAKTESTRRISIKVELGHPCYVYQMKVDVPVINAAPITLWGGYFFTGTTIN
ncbi:hypothetical protein Vretifemale_1444, partial [Volvox reticuliferus]